MAERSQIRSEAARILALAWPVALTSLNWTLLQVTDIVVLGFVGSGEVAAMAASRTLFFIVIVAGLSAQSGILVAASQADGAGDLPRTGGVFREGLLLGLLIGSPIGALLLLFAAPLLAGVGVAAPLVEPAAAVVRVMAIAFPMQMASIAATYFLEGVSAPRRVLAVNLGTLPINAVLAWALSGGHLGLPAWGAVGAATATLIASGLGSVGMIVSVLTLPDRAARDLHLSLRGALAGAISLIKFGIMPAVAAGLELAGFSILIGLSTQLGTTATHAFQIVFSIHNVTFAVALGLGSAAGVRVGNAIGEKCHEKTLFRTLIAVGLAAAATGLLALILLIWGGALAAAFPATRNVHQLAATMLAAWAPFIVFDGVQIVLLYALRSLGDQVAAGVNSILAYFVVTGGLGWWLVSTGGGAMALVWASGIGMVAAAALHGARFVWISSRGRRKSLAPAS